MKHPMTMVLFQEWVHHVGIEEVAITPRSPWQNPYVERPIASIRHECLDHIIVLNEHHLRCFLTSYMAYFTSSASIMHWPWPPPIRMRCSLPSSVPSGNSLRSLASITIMKATRPEQGLSSCHVPVLRVFGTDRFMSTTPRAYGYCARFRPDHDMGASYRPCWCAAGIGQDEQEVFALSFLEVV